MKELALAVLNVMKEVKGIDKTMTVGSGASSYKGVPDQEVKKLIGESMQKNGLCLLPKEIEPTVRVDRWTETGQYGEKQKQSVFTEVKTKYILLHISGEFIELAGYGHGIDSQDKGAGKATTYALKNALLYAFLIPTGKIDDTDAVHSDSIETPKTNGGISTVPQRIESATTKDEVKKVYQSLTKEEKAKYKDLATAKGNQLTN